MGGLQPRRADLQHQIRREHPVGACINRTSQFDGEQRCTRAEQWGGQRAGAGAHIEHQIAGSNARSAAPAAGLTRTRRTITNIAKPGTPRPDGPPPPAL